MCSSTMHSPKAGVSCPQAAGTSHACPASPRGPISTHTPPSWDQHPLPSASTPDPLAPLPWVQSSPGSLYKQTKICWLAEVHHQEAMLVIS
jgi:hypothetical protein